MRPLAIELFSGAGGMSLGFEQAGFDVLAAVDNDPVHLAVHARNFPLTAAICEDAATTTADDLLSAATTAYGALTEGNEDGKLVVDCIFGGPSCQGFSAIGRRDPKDPRNRLLGHFARIVEDIRPRSFVLENVPGLLTPAYAKTLHSLCVRFEKAGYVLANERLPFVLDARDFGVPQRRRRVFLVGVRKGERIPAVPISTLPRVTVADALDDLPDADLFDELLERDWVKLSRAQLRAMDRAASGYAMAMRQPADGFARPREWDATCLTSSGRTVHSPAVRKRFADTPQGSEETVSRNPRLRNDGQSTTLRAGTGRDHGSFSAARPIHHCCPRVVTVREAARLHSLPDWFRLNVTKWHGFRQVGNAVPPLLARAVAASVVDALGWHPVLVTEAVALGDDKLLTMSLEEAADHFGYERELLPRDSRRSGGTRTRNAKKARDG